eukprot:CAMPEP_0196657192 /NCGR_PEP_ID=MMETSP1086-20130531/22488_1 /TAXON_ID=77921 /ORGANISM="Cyanoptyche  gloeocystis , Strain SAG4.97" /LENGTH=400 /DNA_ID=CAMNT_0041990231 /DNA_START=272 /DNA_END=1474 /DNA_ORIENTATION=-
MAASPQLASASPPTSTASKKVVVFGATGQQGSIVVKELLKYQDKFSVIPFVRSQEKMKEIFGNETTKFSAVAQGNILQSSSLEKIFDGVDAVIICVGVPAFPNPAWENGSNTPEKVDYIGVQNIADALPPSVKQVILLSSVGVQRRSSFPFSFLNLFGVLDAVSKGEEAMKATCREKGIPVTIVRPGRLNDTLPPKAQRGMPVLARGDLIIGETSREDVAEAMVKCLEIPSARGITFEIVSGKDASKVASDAAWKGAFDAISTCGTELLSLEFSSVNVDALERLLVQWATTLTFSADLFPPLPAPIRADTLKDGERGVAITALGVDVGGRIEEVGQLRFTIEDVDGTYYLKVRRAGDYSPSINGGFGWAGGWGGKEMLGEKQILGQLGKALSKKIKNAVA